MRRQITFDIDTKVAEKIFGTGYRKIYYDIYMEMRKLGFEHPEGTVYQSINDIEYYDIIYQIRNLLQKYPGLEKCIRDIRLANITKENSLNYLADYDGTTGRYPDISSLRNKTRDDYTR